MGACDTFMDRVCNICNVYTNGERQARRLVYSKATFVINGVFDSLGVEESPKYVFSKYTNKHPDIQLKSMIESGRGNLRTNHNNYFVWLLLLRREAVPNSYEQRFYGIYRYPSKDFILTQAREGKLDFRDDGRPDQLAQEGNTKLPHVLGYLFILFAP